MPELATSILAHSRFMVVLWLHTRVDPPEAEWDAVIEELARTRQLKRIPVEQMRQLVITDGGAPNAVQRTSSAKLLLDGLPSKLGVITTVLSNPLKRGVATALSWLNPAVRFYQPAQLAEALAYLELTDMREAIKLEFHRLQRELTPVNTLALSKL